MYYEIYSRINEMLIRTPNLMELHPLQDADPFKEFWKSTIGWTRRCVKYQG